MCRSTQWATFRPVHVCAFILFFVPYFNLNSFRAYLVLATFNLSVLGYQHFLDSLGISYQVCTYSYFSFVIFIDPLRQPWEHVVPESMFAMVYILSLVLCFAVGVMLVYHLYGVTYGETSVEAQDHEEYRKKARQRNEVYLILSKAIIYPIVFFRTLWIHMTAGL